MALSLSPISYSPPRRVDARTRQILREEEESEEEKPYERPNARDESGNNNINNDNGSLYHNRSDNVNTISTASNVDTVSNVIVKTNANNGVVINNDNHCTIVAALQYSEDRRGLKSLEDVFLSYLVASSISRPSSPLPLFLSHVLAVQRQLVQDEANPVFFSATTTTPRRDDRVAILYHLLRTTPWKLDADQLQRLKSAGDVTWSVGQLLRVALYVAHRTATEDIVRLLKSDGEAGWGTKIMKKTTMKETTTMKTASPSPTATSILRDFSWTDEGFPLMEALGMEEAAEMIDRKVATMEKIVEAEGARRRWSRVLREMGIEDEELMAEEEMDEEVIDEEMDEEEEDVDSVSSEEARCYSPTPQEELVMRIIEVEARNHATVLHILRAVEKLIY